MIEATGLFLKKETVQKHIDAGAKKIIMPARFKDDTPMFVNRVNCNTYAGQPIISNESCTSVFDAEAGIALDDTFLKVVAWYDNEWGYSNKCLDMVRVVSAK